jgi:hypothetical protein
MADPVYVITYVKGKKKRVVMPEATVSDTVISGAVQTYLTAYPPASYTHPSSHPATIITQDTTHQFATDVEKQSWDGKTTIDAVKADTAIAGCIDNSHQPGSDNQAIPDQLSDLSDDSTHRLVTDTEKSTWSGKQDALSSGVNIKTINSTSLIGGGDITISGSSPTSWGKYF